MKNYRYGKVIISEADYCLIFGKPNEYDETEDEVTYAIKFPSFTVPYIRYIIAMEDELMQSVLDKITKEEL